VIAQRANRVRAGHRRRLELGEGAVDVEKETGLLGEQLLRLQIEAGVERRTYQLSIKIPAGVDSGSRLKLRGEGEAGPNGGAPGDLYVLLHVREHPLFVREGHDVVCEVPLSFTQAALGGEVDVPTLGGPAKVKIPAGTQSGQIFRLKGQGVAEINGYGRGDQIVRIIVETPRRLSPRQRALLEEFARLAGEEVHPLAKSFLDKVKSMLG